MIFLFVIISLFLTPTVKAESQVHVENYVESNNDSKIEVNTSTTGQSTYKKVEVTVNGEKHVYESDKPGSQSIKVESKNGKTTITKTENKKVIPTIKVTPFPTPDVFTHVPQTSFSKYITEWIKNLFKKLF